MEACPAKAPDPDLVLKNIKNTQIQTQHQWDPEARSHPRMGSATIILLILAELFWISLSRLEGSPAPTRL